MSIIFIYSRVSNLNFNTCLHYIVWNKSCNWIVFSRWYCIYVVFKLKYGSDKKIWKYLWRPRLTLSLYIHCTSLQILVNAHCSNNYWISQCHANRSKSCWFFAFLVTTLCRPICTLLSIPIPSPRCVCPNDSFWTRRACECISQPLYHPFR